MQQERYDLADQELRQLLAAEPDHAHAHALLGLCAARREQFREAIAEAQQAVHLAPDDSYSHYVLACVLGGSNRLREAEASIQEAIRLNPTDPDCFTRLAEICFAQRRWQDTLDAAEHGLQFDPEHIQAINLRAMALVKLGRQDAAGAALQTALERNPEDALTHSNQGWRLIEAGEYDKALEHFREALRIDPEVEWARQGIVEALQARNIIYRMMLRYFLWMMKLSGRAQWAVVIGGYVGYRVLQGLARNNPDLAPWITPLLILYIAFAIMTWVSVPLFNLLLRLNRFGRLALSREQIITSNWVGCCVAGALVSLGLYLGLDYGAGLLSALICAMLIPPISGVYKCDPGWPRTMAVLIALGLLACGLLSAGLLWSATFVEGDIRKVLGGLGFLLFWPFVLGAFASQFAVPALAAARPRR
jgi:tetratricopeptide (TPR) repeat protein